jgi:hypothetical protein
MLLPLIWLTSGMVAYPTFPANGIASYDLVCIEPTSFRLSVTSNPTYYVSWLFRQQPNVLLAGCSPRIS